jgi:hypothetical protein
VAVAAGVAFSDAGVARAGMGTDAADYDGSGRPSLVVGNFLNEMMALFSNQGGGLFIDKAPGSTVGRASLQRLTFSAFFFDADLDGRPDILGSNGHVADDVQKVQPNVGHAQPPLLLRNAGGGKFEDYSARVGDAFAVPIVGRGAAYGDFDNDGDLDLLLTSNGGPARLLRSDGASGTAVRVTLAGSGTNRSAIGAKVRVVRDGGPTAWQMVKTGSSYLSQSELPLTFGLGAGGKVTGIEVSWPSGRSERLGGVAAGTAVTIVEGKGIARTTPLR